MSAREETAAARYAKYRVRLRMMVYWIWRGVRLWGKWVWLNHWTVYDGEELRRKFGRKWSVELAQYQSYMRFEVVGVGEKGEEAPLSNWRLEELQRREDIAAALARQQRTGERGFRDVDAIAAELQGIPGLGEGEIAYHLREHEGFSPALTIRVMRRLGYEDVDARNLPKKRGYGGDRIRRGLACGACEPDKSGRQRNKRELPG